MHQNGVEMAKKWLCHYLSNIHRDPVIQIACLLCAWLLLHVILHSFSVISIYPLSFSITTISDVLLSSYTFIFVICPVILLLYIIIVLIRNSYVYCVLAYWKGYVQDLPPQQKVALFKKCGALKQELHYYADVRYQQTVCNICQVSNPNDQGVNVKRIILACGHLFCQTCLNKWESYNPFKDPKFTQCACCREVSLKEESCIYDKNHSTGGFFSDSIPRNWGWIQRFI